MSADLLAALPPTFRYSQARECLNERQFRKLIDEGEIIAIARGLYRKRGLAGDDDLIDLASRSPDATLCLRSALARHDLIDDIPAEIDIAIPRGAWTPHTEAPVRWRHFDTKTFPIGRGLLDIGDESTIGLYSAERSIIDAFRMRNIEGPELANESLKRWLRSGGRPSELLRVARDFPRTLTPLRQTMEILL
ncbi:type IV toxin-antitoxin system AbiEi family antitoxin domain-containing protein [Oerskovia merdavium]|uniref:type IV toxin-antitoxin system AbiEi family antitoxin domain-containing protein n=1 Tax=Oerskovia merdavium TaxID=2762227 RepID=UPI001CD8700A|nr:type IV toxin-antitoxin system AbiEi family antitoxin domain-containing protein [Oerskovia merdavium]